MHIKHKPRTVPYAVCATLFVSLALPQYVLASGEELPDDDNDGIHNIIEGSETQVDTDGDSIPDYLDTDSDNDGIPDSVEQPTAPTLSSSESNSGVTAASVTKSQIDTSTVANARQTQPGEYVTYVDAIEYNGKSCEVRIGVVENPNNITVDLSGLVFSGTLFPILLTGGPDKGVLLSLEYFETGTDTVCPFPMKLNWTDVDNFGTGEGVEFETSDVVSYSTGANIDKTETTESITSGTGAYTFFNNSSGRGNTPANAFSTDLGVRNSIEFSVKKRSSSPGYIFEHIIGTTSVAHSIEGLVDTDGDDTPDFRDLDSDNDSISDELEAGTNPETPVDTDGDNAADYLDLDSDNDTLADSIEGLVDTDTDGAADFRDLDSDNDTLPDSVEAANGPVDTDSDGTPDFRDLDSDDDSISDELEAGANPESPVDTDGDNASDYIDLDSDNDSIPDAVEGTDDSDTDGAADFRDTDSDDDGLLDSEESSEDTDNDGIPNSVDTDSDGDGIPDQAEGTGDFDNDGIPNRLDLDSDNDSIPDRIEQDVDTDADGSSDYLDTDSDNDGIADAIEAGNATPVDTDSDSIPDYLDLDSDNDGLTDAFEAINTDAPVDSDRDTIPNYLDLDSDNDGLTDTQEAGGLDVDRNGIIDDFIDSDQNGLHDAVTDAPLPAGDFDADRVPDHLDLDSDNDGLSDGFETSGTEFENNGDGIIDNFIDANLDGLDDTITALPLPNIDIDADGMPNHLDLDTDNDFFSDLREGSFDDENGDMIIDSLRDIDADGIPDSVDVDFTNASDEDGDGISDFADVDFTGLLNDDADGDGIIDSFDPDANGNGFADDSEGDAAPFEFTSALPDADQNGILDIQEQNFALRTGLEGSAGCTLSTTKQKLDPTLAALFLISGMFVTRRRKSTKTAK